MAVCSVAVVLVVLAVVVVVAAPVLRLLASAVLRDEAS